MRRVTQQRKPAPCTRPRRQRVSVDQLPVHQARRLFHDGLAHRVPPFQHLENILKLPGKGPRLLDVGFVFVRQDPAAVLAALDGAEQEMHVRPDPAVEGVAVLAEVLRARIGDHVFVGEPGAPDGVAAALGLVVVAEHQLACFGADAVRAEYDVCRDLGCTVSFPKSLWEWSGCCSTFEEIGYEPFLQLQAGYPPSLHPRNTRQSSAPNEWVCPARLARTRTPQYAAPLYGH